MNSERLCKDACDSQYSRAYYYLKQQNVPSDMLGFYFAVKDYFSLVFEEIPSLNLTKMLIKDDVIDSLFQENKKVCLQDISKHISKELQGKSAIFFCLV